MQLLVIGIIIFIVIHLVPTIGSVRESMVGKLGEAGYKSLFSILSAGGFVMMLMGAGRAEFVPVYNSPAWSTAVVKLVMLPAFILLIAAYYPNNIKRWVRHPMLIGIALWSAAHLLANGDRTSIILFGGLFCYSLFALLSMSWRDNTVPPSTRKLNDIVVMAVGTIVFVLVYKIHGAVFAPIS